MAAASRVFPCKLDRAQGPIISIRPEQMTIGDELSSCPTNASWRYLDGDVVVDALDVAEIVVIDLRLPEIIAVEQFPSFVVRHVVYHALEVHDSAGTFRIRRARPALAGSA